MSSITVAETTLFVRASDGFLYRAAPAGTGWTWSKSPLRGGSSIVRKGRYLFATGKTLSDLKPSVFRSEDNGTSWQEKAASFPTDEQMSGGPFLLAKVGGNLFVSLHDGGNLFLSTDDAETWSPFADRPETRYVYIEVLEAVGGDLLAMSEDGLFRLSTGFSSIRPVSRREGHRFRIRDGSRTLLYRFDSPGWARLDLFTTMGQLAVPVFQGLQTWGTRAFPLAPRVPPGTYLLRVQTQRTKTSHMLRIE